MDILMILLYVSIALFTLVLLTAKYTFFGLQFLFAKARFKDNLGLIFYRGLGGNYGFPKFIDLSKLSTETKDGVMIHLRDSFKGFRFWNTPCAFLDVEDTSVTVGFYKKIFTVFQKKENVDEYEGINQLSGEQVLEWRKVEANVEKLKSGMYSIQPATHLLATADGRTIDTKIPLLIESKPSVRITKETLKQAIIQLSFNQALAEFLQKYQWILMLSAGTLICAGFGAYMTYSVQGEVVGLCNTNMQSAIDMCRSAINVTREMVIP
jgi:hypothetical protein